MSTGAPRVSGVVLAGGRSARFGSDKLSARIGERTLLERAVGALAAVCADVVVVIARDGPAPDLPGPAGLAPVRILRDPVEGGGPLVGLETGLRAAPGAIVLAVAGDMPDLVPDVLGLLVGAVASGASAAALAVGGQIRPLPTALDRARALAAVPAVRRAGSSSLRALVSALEPIVIPEDSWRAVDPDGRTLLDVDRREDLDRVAGTVSPRDAP